MKRFILWDHDGVLVDTEPWYFEATRRSIAALGVELDLAEYLKDMATGRSAWHRAKALGASEQDVEHHRARRNALYQEFLVTQDIEIPGAEAVLAELAQRFEMAIVTTAKRVDFDLIHAERHIVDHVRFVLANGDYERSKPAPDPYLAALDRFEARREEAIVVEDSERGLKAAVAAGIECVIVAHEFVAGHDLSAASYRIDGLAELPPLLERINEGG